MMKPTILVTGGAGYIGSHTVRQLQQAGYAPLILDNLTTGHRDIAEQVLKAELVIGDIGDRTLLNRIFATRNIEAVIHFAAHAYVGESVKDPAKYYNNNVTGSLTLLQAMVAAGVDKFIFSSTCATYGIPAQVPVPEDHPQAPINPYGQSKLMLEKIAQDFGRAYGLKSVCFRFFNAAGAHPAGDLGEDHMPEPHLIPRILYAALGKGSGISIFGTDYPTPDGTCVRDYVHVLDLAQAHVMGLEYLIAGGNPTSFNLGSNCGFSVREVIETARTITGYPLEYTECARRPGDPPTLVGDYTKATQVLGWRPQHSELKTMLADAWQWHQHRHGLPTIKRTTIGNQPQITLAPPPSKKLPVFAIFSTVTSAMTAVLLPPSVRPSFNKQKKTVSHNFRRFSQTSVSRSTLLWQRFWQRLNARLKRQQHSSKSAAQGKAREQVREQVKKQRPIEEAVLSARTRNAQNPTAVTRNNNQL